MKKKYNIYKMELLPVAVEQMTCEEISNKLGIRTKKCYPSKKDVLHNSEYLITHLEDIRRNRYADALMHACAELSKMTGESTDDCIRRMMRKVLKNG